jgi:hypothetical protein
MATYVIGSGMISPQKTWGQTSFLSEPIDYPGNRLRCIEPDYSAFVDVRQLRRMSRILKLGVAAGMMAMRDAGVSLPDGIITGTGYGCLEDTGTFLAKMIENDEMALNPTPFIQSTHNTIGSQIALFIGCQGYNQTYTQQSFSFETALIDAMLELEDMPGQRLLVGGVDEITDYSYTILNRFRVVRQESKRSLTSINDRTRGIIVGEGAGYFMLSGDPGKDGSIQVESVSTFRGGPEQGLQEWIRGFFGGLPGKADVALLGQVGDEKFDGVLDDSTFQDMAKGYFKHLCGEYPTGSTFAFWLALMMLKHQTIPTAVADGNLNGPLRRIVIYNPYFGRQHSLISLAYVQI